MFRGSAITEYPKLQSRDYKEAFKVFNGIADIFNNFELSKAFSKIKTRKQGLELIDMIIKRRVELKESDEFEVMERLKPLFSKIRLKFVGKLASSHSKSPKKRKMMGNRLSSNSQLTLEKSNSQINTSNFKRLQSEKKISMDYIQSGEISRKSRAVVLKTFLKPNRRSFSPKKIKSNRAVSQDLNLRQRLVGSVCEINENSDNSIDFNKRANYFESVNNEYRKYIEDKKYKYHKKSNSMPTFSDKIDGLKILEDEIFSSIINDRRLGYETPEILDAHYAKQTSENKIFSKVDKNVKSKFANYIQSFKSNEMKDYFTQSLRRFSALPKHRSTILMNELSILKQKSNVDSSNAPKEKKEVGVKEKIQVPMYIQTGMGYKKYYRYPKPRNRKQNFIS